MINRINEQTGIYFVELVRKVNELTDEVNKLKEEIKALKDQK